MKDLELSVSEDQQVAQLEVVESQITELSDGRMVGQLIISGLKPINPQE